MPRLARFNINRDVVLPETTRPHFVGVPAPGAAVLALLPVLLFKQGFTIARDAPVLCGVYIGLIGLMMVSDIATPSSKAIKIPHDKAVWVLIGVAVIVGLAVTRFWLLTALLGVVYLLVICWSVWRHRPFRLAPRRSTCTRCSASARPTSPRRRRSPT